MNIDHELWIIPLLFAACFGSLAYALLTAFREGAQRYTNTQLESTARQLEDVFLFIPARRVTDMAWALAATVFLVFFLALGDLRTPQGLAVGAVMGLLGGGLGFHLPRFALQVVKRRRLQQFDRQLLDALMTMSNSLRAGFSIHQSFEAVVNERQAPIAQEFGMFLHKTRVGVDFDEALRAMEERVQSEDLTLMTRAIETARLTGGNLTEVFERIAETIRERVRIEGRIRSLTAQGRMQALVVGAMPVLLLIAMSLLDTKMMVSFMTSRLGIAMLLMAAIMEILGVVIIRRIVGVKV